jgi:hypothetical protein
VPIRACIDIRTSVRDALESWAEFAAPSNDGHRVDFEALAPVASRVAVEVAERGPSQRALERQLRAFKSFAEYRRARG